MNRNALLAVVAIAFAACFYLGQGNSTNTVAAQESAPAAAKKWDYAGVGADNAAGAPGAVANLKRLGDEGWEVCGTLSSTGEYPAIILLKRPK